MQRLDRSKIPSALLKNGIAAAAIVAFGYGVAEENDVGESVQAAGVIACLIFGRGVYKDTRFLSRSRPIRGRTLLTQEEARDQATQTLTHDDPGTLWGNVPFPSRSAFSVSSYAIIGAVGSGKTLTIRIHLKQHLPTILPKSGRRAVILDVKGDMVQIVASLALTAPVVMINAFDERGVGYHLADDIRTPVEAAEAAMVLIPPGAHDAQPFFKDSARALLAGVFATLNRKRPGTWSLRQAVLIATSKDRLRRVLEADPHNRDLVATFINCGDQVFSNVMGVLVTSLSGLFPVAAAWEHASRRVSARSWAKSESVLILGNDERHRATLDRINHLFITLASKQLLAGPEVNELKTLVYADELSELGALSNEKGGALPSLVLRGRSKGVSCVVGFQDVQAVQHVYGEKLASAMVAACANKCFLRMDSPATAKFASDVISNCEIWISEPGASYGPQGVTRSVSSKRTIKAQVLEGEFLSLPVTTRENGLTGFYVAPSLAYEGHYTSEELRELVGDMGSVPAFIPAPAEWQILQPWNGDDDQQFGLLPTPTPSPRGPFRPAAGGSTLPSMRPFSI